MSSLNQLVSELAHVIGDPNNVPLRRHIRQSIIHHRNELIRQSFNRHNYIDKQLWQRYKVSLIDVPESDVVGVELGERIKRSKYKILKPVRFTDNLPLKSVRTLGAKPIEIAHAKQASGRFYASLPGMCAMPVYDLINYYLYINYTNSRIDLSAINSIIVEAPFEYPHLVLEETFEGKIVADDLYHQDTDKVHHHFDDDDEFLLPEDMIPQLKELILKRGIVNISYETNESPKSNIVNT